jgi:hypothetical protein
MEIRAMATIVGPDKIKRGFVASFIIRKQVLRKRVL